MGRSTFDPSAYTAYASSTKGRTTRDYTSRTMPAKYDPKQINIRESVASAINPHPTPLIVGLDVSGSMGHVVEACRQNLGTLFEQVIDRKPISDPHVMAMAIGDFDYDGAPCQATQFEADPVTIGKQIEELYLEGGGGGNSHESYLGPLYFALHRTHCDAFKAGRKGFLFTVGDEQPQFLLTREQVERFFGDKIEADLTAQELVTMVERNWHYFHLIVQEGNHARAWPELVRTEWTSLIGQRAIPLSNHAKMAEVIISLMEVTVGRDKAAVTASWKDKGTAMVVSKAIEGLPATTTTSGGASAPVAL